MSASAIRKRWSGDGWDLYLGDSLLVLRELDADSFDALITDPPYSSGGATRSDRSASTGTKYSRAKQQKAVNFDGDSRDQRALELWTALWTAECLRVVRRGGHASIFTDWRSLPSIVDAYQAGGWVHRALVPWVKQNARPHLGRPRAQCEFVVWGTRGAHKAYEGAPCIDGFYHCASPRDRVHITQKPVPLMVDLVSLTPPGAVVLDPFGGSGTTAIAALRSGRRIVVIESNPDVADICVTRLVAESAGVSLHEYQAGQVGMFGSEAPA